MTTQHSTDDIPSTGDLGLLLEERPAKGSASPASAKDSKTTGQTSASTSAGSPTNSTRKSSSGRTSPELFQCETTHSAVLSRKLSGSTPPSYTLTPPPLPDGGSAGASGDSRSGPTRVWLLDPNEPPAGEFSIANFLAWPNDASVCSLSQILLNSQDAWVRQNFKSESDFMEWLRQYFLSPKCCAGILRRAEKRGKKLPPLLVQALQAVAQEVIQSE